MFRRSTSSASEHERPPRIVACFLVRFDRKIGYTITWKRAVSGLELEGYVEYSSLPSGLHKVKEDLVYYTHEQFAGVSAFLQEPSSESERNAQFLAVGILCPLQGEWLGKAWLHALQLRLLAKDILKDVDQTYQLENYWQTYRVGDTVEERVETGSLEHPLLSTLQMLDEFGPLLFPVYRAALLRQRLLLIKEPPVRICCEYVYILSLITYIPSELAKKVLTDTSPSKIVPLFNIGISNIPTLESAAAIKDVRDRTASKQSLDGHAAHDNGVSAWIACSSDELLYTKPSLSDIRITLSADGLKKCPVIHTSDGRHIKATQRDLRRYKALRQGLHTMQKQSQHDDSDELQYRQSSSALLGNNPFAGEVDIATETSMAEQQSWAAMAYDSYMWWASGGEWSADLQEELNQYEDLLRVAGEVYDDMSPIRQNARTDHIRPTMFSGRVENVLISYFRGLTTSIMESLKRLVADAASVNNSRVFVSKDDLVWMGLDPWSKNDRLWVVDMIKAYFDVDAEVQGASIECCGLNIY